MAEIVITINTEKETIIATIDGKKVPDVQEVRAYMVSWSDDPEVRVEIVSGTKDEESGINRTTITSVAAESGVCGCCNKPIKECDCNANCKCKGKGGTCAKVEIKEDKFREELATTLLGYNVK